VIEEKEKLYTPDRSEGGVPLIELKNCTMQFPGVKALDNVNFTLMPGECHALVGENGAGKSTLSKCITGEYRMTEGDLYVKGKQIKTSSYSIHESQERGIAIVHQELTLMNDMTGAENLFIGSYLKKNGFVDWKGMTKRAQKIMHDLQVDIDVTVPVRKLRTAEKQIIQLAKALLNDPKIIIFDELTSVLQQKDINNIYQIIKRLTGKGIGIIYISHRLNEVFDVCDSYTVLTDGKYMGSGKVKNITYDGLVKLIIGRELTNVYPPINTKFGENVLETKGLTAADNVFRNININVREGEVVGIAGLVGAGKTELLQAIYGNYKVSSGKVLIQGQEIEHASTHKRIQMGLGLVPDERRSLGLITSFDIKDNTILPSLDKFKIGGFFQDHKAELRAAYDVDEELKLKYDSLWTTVSNLSGGNQQKIVIAKWILRETDIFLMDEPTRGIDIGAKVEIYNLIRKLTDKKKAVLLVSPEMDELIGLCNRIYIMYEGAMMDEVSGERKTQDVIIKSLLGGS
jgi:ABC-type sugar transport system ATPase subunit